MANTRKSSTSRNEETPSPLARVTTKSGATDPDFARLVNDLPLLDFVCVEHSTGGSLTLGLKSGKGTGQGLRFRLRKPDSSLFRSGRVENQRKITATLQRFHDKGEEGRKFDWIPCKAFKFDHELSPARRRARLASAKRPTSKATAPLIQISIPSTKQMLEWVETIIKRIGRKDAIQFGMKCAFASAVFLIVATLGFGMLFEKVNILRPATGIEIIGLQDLTELDQLLRTPSISVHFSNLVVSTGEPLALARLKREAEMSQLASLTTRELAWKYSNVAPDKVAQLTNALEMIESDRLRLQPEPMRYSSQSSVQGSEIHLPAGVIANAFGISYGDALRVKAYGDRGSASTYSSSLTDEERNALNRHLAYLEPAARRLESEVRRSAATSISNNFAPKMSPLQEIIHEFERRLLAECRNRSLVFRLPFSDAIFASRRTQFLIVVYPANPITQAESDVVFCGAAGHGKDSSESPNREHLFDFLRRKFFPRE